jgi:hypothetical protein
MIGSKIAKDVGFHSLPMDRSTIGEASFRRAMLQPSLERRTAWRFAIDNASPMMQA